MARVRLIVLVSFIRLISIMLSASFITGAGMLFWWHPIAAVYVGSWLIGFIALGVIAIAVDNEAKQQKK